MEPKKYSKMIVSFSREEVNTICLELNTSKKHYKGLISFPATSADQKTIYCENVKIIESVLAKLRE